MIRGRCFFMLGFFLLGLLLSGCPKKIPGPVIIEKPSAEHPMAKFLEAFSSAESLQAKASIRINMVRNGQEVNFPSLNGVLLYQKPDQFRLLGYHPLGMGLFDALYKNGELFILIPLQKRAYSGEVLKTDDLIEKAGPMEVFIEKPEGSEIPNRIRIELVEKEIRIDLRLKEISINSLLPEESFQWVVPEGVEVQPLNKLLRKKSR
jgi:outer membrane lipoprotein-sorting protein